MGVFFITLIAGAGVALVFYGAYGHLAAAVDVIEMRLGRYAGTHPDDAVDEFGAKKQTGLSKAVNTFVDRQSFAERIKLDLQRADVKLTPGEFVFLRLAAFGVGALLGFLVFQVTIVAVIIGVVAYNLPKVWLKTRVKSRERHFAALLGEAVLMMSSSLRAGYSMMQALETIAREMQPPISDEFRRVTLEVGVGIPVEDALAHLVNRVKSVDLELMTIAMNVQREVGGNLAEILDTIGATIRERQELQGEIRTLTAQGRISAYIISLLPVALTGALFLMNRAYIQVLWTTTIGMVESGIAITMVVVGFYVTRRVATVEV